MIKYKSEGEKKIATSAEVINAIQLLTDILEQLSDSLDNEWQIDYDSNNVSMLDTLKRFVEDFEAGKVKITSKI